MQETQQNEEGTRLYRLGTATIVLQVQPNELAVELLVVPAPANSVHGAILTNEFLKLSSGDLLLQILHQWFKLRNLSMNFRDQYVGIDLVLLTLWSL